METWLVDARQSYDTVAKSYADFVRGYPEGQIYSLSTFALFADLVNAAGGGTVADIGCGPGHVTVHLRNLGLDAFGVDLSPGMIELARGEHPGVRFEVGSMTALDLENDSLGGIVAWYSTIHVPDEELGTAFAQFHRVLRPGAPVLLGFHAGEGSKLKTEGYGGHPMKIYVHRRTPAQVGARLEQAGFAVEARTLLLDDSYPGGIVIARRPTV
jgi:SAM-dependent methyltransferase